MMSSIWGWQRQSRGLDEAPLKQFPVDALSGIIWARFLIYAGGQCKNDSDQDDKWYQVAKWHD